MSARDMKSYVFSAMLATLAVAEVQAEAPAWSSALPGTGLAPSAFTYKYASTMRERHGGDSHFGIQGATLTIPLSDPRASAIGNWAINAELVSALTWVDAEGTLDLKSETLYKFTLPISFIRPMAGGDCIILAAAPTVASDLECGARCFDFGFFAAYTKKWSDSFNFTLGMAGYPRFARYYAVPVFGAEWKPSEDWTLSIQGYRFSAMNALTERLSAGLFVSGEGGVWAVETGRGARLLNVQSLVVGVRGEYDFSSAGQRKRIITAALGSTLTTSVRFHEFHGDRDADEMHHYRPGIYASVGVDFRF